MDWPNERYVHVVRVRPVWLSILGVVRVPRHEWFCTCGRVGFPTREFAARAGGSRHALRAA